MGKVVAQLSDAATDEQWQIDWHHFNKFREAAAEAAKNKKYDDAFRESCRAISFMMSQLREHRRSL
jgi:hypothetical protein